MSRKILDKLKKRLAAETGDRSSSWGGRLSVALVFPNTYRQAMSNLGFLTVYHLLNARPDSLCERFFLPDAEDAVEHRKTGFPLVSLDSGTPLTDFDVIAFSISFENDYLNLPILFDMARIPLFSSERGDRYPLVLCGGVCAFLNPEPLAPVMDAFAVGEAEEILPLLTTTLAGAAGVTRSSLLKDIATLPGMYVPSLYEVEYDGDGTIRRYSPKPGAPEKVRRQWVKDLDSTESRSFILTGETEFGDMALTEISRGCSRGCRFCAAGYLYLPPRERSLDNLRPQIEEGLCRRDKIGLVGAAVSDYRDIGQLSGDILSRGGKVSVASLRIDSLTAEEIAALQASGHRTVSLAPEAGSQRLRDLINKGLDEHQILAAVRLLARAGIPHLKLYFLIGLPTESGEDIDELLALAGKIREIRLEEGRKKGRLGHLTLSVNPFIPKPFTPLQWAPMDADRTLQEKIRTIRSGVARLANTEVIFESVKSAGLQAFLSRGDRRVARILPALGAGKSLKNACRESGIDPGFYTTRARGADEIFPWEILDNGVTRQYLHAEYMRALAGRATPRCTPGCRRCGVCG